MSKKRRTNIKEYIYVDNVEINSILAQFEDGIPQVIKSIRQSTNTNTEQAGKNHQTNISGGAQLIAKGQAEQSWGKQHAEIQSNAEMNQEAIDTVYSDYAIDIIEQELESHNLLESDTKHSDGVFVKFTSQFSLLDLQSMRNTWTTNEIKPLVQMTDDYDESWDAAAESLKNSSIVLDNMFPETIFFKFPEAVAFAEKNNFRMSLIQLQMLTFSKRKVTILGKIESSVPNDESIDDIFGTENRLEESDDNIDLTALGQWGPALGVKMLKIFLGIKKGNRFIKPIAIYFE
ncbi:DUF6414 family protein [Secundilactobacillus mixtipabuli]|uniref:DUF6414 family protein n=1 Tax=Secundilactobacillus mixtipabuli TaxID=1435342 RepID=UPI001179BE14|nr:hypothetical protein [Secundilactobacillus mixtipabuli]